MKPTYTIDEEITELNRELVMRRNVYSKWIMAGKMKREDADRQIKRLESALTRLKNLKNKNQTSLF